MGIFTKKEVCPLCGRTIRGDVRYRIKDNVEICKNCSSEIAMDAAMIPNMSVDEMKAHLAYREENKKKMENFQTAWNAEAGAYILRADNVQCLWYCTNNRSDRNPPLFEFEELKSAVYLEDGEPAEELATGLKALFAERTAPELVQSMKVEIEIDNPYIHKINIETVGPGKGMTTGTMQYKMNRRAIQKMMNVLLSIQRFAEGDTENLPAMDDMEEIPDVYPDGQQASDDADPIPGGNDEQ